MTHLGRDFSSFQGNLSAEDCAGIDFAFVKASQGGEYKNPYAPRQVSALRAAGVKVGYYHFFTMTDLVGDQLNNFHQMAQALGATELPLAVDNEVADPLGWADFASKLMDFVTGVEAWTNWVPHTHSILYDNLSFAASLPGFPWGRWVWLADPNPGAPHRPCLVLQQAPRPVSGTDLKVIDPDVFMGTEEDWAAFTGQVAPGPSPAPVPVLDLPTVPGPNGLQLVVLGHMNGGGVFQGHNVTPGTTVYAGIGDPTVWVVGQDPKHLPAGTPLAVAISDRYKVSPQVVTEQL